MPAQARRHEGQVVAPRTERVRALLPAGAGAGEAPGSPTSQSSHPLVPANTAIGQTQLEARMKRVAWARPYSSDSGTQSQLDKVTSGSGGVTQGVPHQCPQEAKWSDLGYLIGAGG